MLLRCKVIKNGDLACEIKGNIPQFCPSSTGYISLFGDVSCRKNAMKKENDCEIIRKKAKSYIIVFKFVHNLLFFYPMSAKINLHTSL